MLRFDSKTPAEPLLEAARRRGVPLTMLDVQPGREFDKDVYARALVLARPDQHIAWRGDALPADCASLVELIRGATVRIAQQKKVA